MLEEDVAPHRQFYLVHQYELGTTKTSCQRLEEQSPMQNALATMGPIHYANGHRRTSKKNPSHPGGGGGLLAAVRRCLRRCKWQQARGGVSPSASRAGGVRTGNCGFVGVSGRLGRAVDRRQSACACAGACDGASGLYEVRRRLYITPIFLPHDSSHVMPQ